MPSTQYLRTEEPWSDYDEDRMLRLFGDGVPLPDICRVLDRSPCTVVSRLSYLDRVVQEGSRIYIKTAWCDLDEDFS